MAVCISLFVLPGLGHTYLGKKLKGSLIALIVCVLLLALIVIFEWKVIELSNQLLAEKGQLFSHLWTISKQAFWEQWSLHAAGLGLITAIWIYAAIDCYYAGGRT